MIPYDATPFFGRETELTAIEERFFSGARLVVITGPPGMGKSRLIQEFCHRAKNPVAETQAMELADLRDVSTPTQLLEVLSETLSLRLDQSLDFDHAVLALAEQLNSRGPTLLLIDHGEQVIDAIQKLVDAWLSRLRSMHFLIASRQRLRLRAENIIELHGLPLAGPDGELESSDAFALFMARARAVAPDFKLDEKTTSIVAEIIAELRGLPLALELGASRIAVTDPEGLLSRLRRDLFQVLKPGMEDHPGLPALTASIRTTWQALTPWEQEALAQCAVFRGGFDIDLAEEVLDLSAFDDAPAVIDVLQTLRTKSLLSPPRQGLPAGVLQLYRFVGEFAARELATRLEEQGARRRHARAIASRAAAFADQEWFWNDGRPRSWFLANAKNIDFALSYVLENLENLENLDKHDKPELFELARALGYGLLIASPWLPATLERAEAIYFADDFDATPMLFRFGARIAEGRFATGHPDQGSAIFEDLLKRARTTSQTTSPVELELRQLLGEVRWQEPGAALQKRTDQMVSDTSSRSDLLPQALAHFARGQLLRNLGHIHRAQQAMEEAVDLARSCKALPLAIEIEHLLGHLALEAGEPERATRHFEEMKRAAGTTESFEATRLAEAALAISSREIGDFQGSREVFGNYIMTMIARGHACDWTLALEYALALLDMQCWQEVESLLQRIETSTRRYDSPFAPMAIAVHRALLQASQDQLPAARATLAPFLDQPRTSLWGQRLHTLDALLTSLEGQAFPDEELSSQQQAFEETGHHVQAQSITLVRAANSLSAPATLESLLATLFEQRGSAPPWILRSAWIRVLTRLLEPHLELQSQFALFARSVDPARTHLVLHEQGGLFRAPRAAEVADIRPRTLVSQLLQTLLEQYHKDPTTPLSTADLFERIWPDETFGLSAPQRIYNKISLLKKQGLRDVLLSNADGYLLDPAVAVCVFVDARGLVDNVLRAP